MNKTKSAQLLQSRLERVKSQGLKRILLPPGGSDFSSNDYLGFARDPVLQQRFQQRLQELPTGASGSRLLRGNLAIYEETETKLVTFTQREAALLFSSGYMANVGLLSALLCQNDLVFSDALNHASLIDGIRLSRSQKVIFPHRDYAYLEQQLQMHHAHQGLKVIVTESLFSMEGTFADLNKLAALAQKFNALLIVDEAHSTGLWGASLVAHLGLTDQVFASIHTGGKALGAAGAWIACDRLLRDYLINFSRPFIFSTAPIPALAVLLQEAIHFHNTVGAQRAKTVLARAQQLRHFLSLATDGQNNAPIIIVPIGKNSQAIAASQFLQRQGYDIRAIRPPTVPTGTARLRITVQWSHTETQLKELAQQIKFSVTQ